MSHAIAYYRVSTQQQGRSGLGIEAQKAAVARFAENEGIEIVAEHVEVETGKGADALDRRPAQTASPRTFCRSWKASGPRASRATLGLPPHSTAAAYARHEAGSGTRQRCETCSPGSRIRGLSRDPLLASPPESTLSLLVGSAH